MSLNNEQIQKLIPLAESGNIEAQVDLAWEYFSYNETEAFKWFHMAANSGNIEAQKQLGYMCHYGLGVEKNDVKSFKWYLSSAKLNDKESLFIVGWHFYEGYIVKQDFDKAFDYLFLSAKQNFEPAKLYLGYCYFYGNGTKINYAKAFKMISEYYHFRKGTCDFDEFTDYCYYELGYMYNYGLGVQQDLDKAWDFLCEASDGTPNEMKAEYELAKIYEEASDIKNAIEYYTKSADKGLSLAQCRLGQLYLQGIGIEPDYHKAFELFSKAATRNSDALYELGQLYLTGKGVEKNTNTALELFLDALEKGNEKAKTALKSLFGILPNNNA